MFAIEPRTYFTIEPRTDLVMGMFEIAPKDISFCVILILL